MLFFIFESAWAQGFVVDKIEIQGLQRTNPETVISYLPIKRGQVLEAHKTAAVLKALYRTGFFDHISLSKRDHTLIIHVVERPTIGQLKISGNSIIPTDKLTSVMKSLDVAEGRVYNPAVLEKIKQSLLNQYYLLGRYNARVTISATHMPRNRVLVQIELSEGLVAKVKRISIIGNHAFSERKLVNQLDISTAGLFTLITQGDRYSEEKLDASLDKLRAFYMDRGYLRFEIKSAQAEIAPDRKSVYVHIVIDEGKPYTLKGYQVKGNTVLSSKEIDQVFNFKNGETFSRLKVINAEKAITNLLGDRGYLYAAISLQPDVNDKTHQVFLTLNIKPGKKVYVRHITFSENTRTNDRVLRREMKQMEAALASTSRLDDSKQSLSMLPYIKDVEMNIKPVPDVDDEVDVNYKVKEENSAQASLKIGYSQLYRTILGVGLNHKNFFGTGNTLGINFNHSKYQQYYGVDYTNPYYTEDGISRTYNFSIQRVDPAGAGVNIGYTTHEYDAGVFYSIPVGQERQVINRIQTGVGYQNILINLVPKYLSNQINTYVTNHGTHFQELDLRLGFSRDSRDKAILPTRGALQTLFLDAYAPLTHGSVSFYTLNYHTNWYVPLIDQFILLNRVDLGYGNGLHGAQDFPFFKNFLAGGIDSVRGYQGYTLGPKDSAGQPFGGNMYADAGIGLIFPNYISDNLRTSAFVDAGNVYSSKSNLVFGGQSTDSGPLRYSTGIEIDWINPIAPIKLSLAKPLNRRPGDNQESFQFALGANF